MDNVEKEGDHSFQRPFPNAPFPIISFLFLGTKPKTTRLIPKLLQ